MAVITISRGLGSMGTYIGQRLAQELGYAYVDKQLLSTMMKEYGFSKFDNIYESVPGFWEKYDIYREMTVEFLAEVILAVAHHDDVVIAGRGSFGLLGGMSDVINVRIKAPMGCRIHRLMHDCSISEKEATERIKQSDRVRRSFVENDFRFNYRDSSLFDLILDTSIIEPEACVTLLSKATAPRDDTRPSLSTLEIEPVLVEHVARELVEHRLDPETIVPQVESC